MSKISIKKIWQGCSHIKNRDRGVIKEFGFCSDELGLCYRRRCTNFASHVGRYPIGQNLKKIFERYGERKISFF
jgi:hypothetical protein